LRKFYSLAQAEPLKKSERLDAFLHLVERFIQLAVLSGTATQNRFKVGEIGDVDNKINTVNEGAHSVVGGEAMAQQGNEIFPPLRVWALDHLAHDRVRLQGGAFEVFVNHNHVIAVGLEFKEHIFLEQPKVHFVGHVDKLRHDNLLILLMIDANEGGAVAEIEKCRVVDLFHVDLAKCVFRNIEAQTGVEIVVHAATFLNQINPTRDSSLLGREKIGSLFRNVIILVGAEN